VRGLAYPHPRSPGPVVVDQLEDSKIETIGR